MTDVATSKDFQARMFERIRDQIGDLLTEDDLKRIVETAVNKALWEKKVTPRSNYSGYGEQYDTTDGVLMTEFRALVKDRLSAGIRDYLRENEEKLMEVMRQEAGKLWPAMLAGMFKSIAEQNSFAFVQELRNQGMLR